MTQIIEAVEDSPLILVPQKSISCSEPKIYNKTICYHAATMANDIKEKNSYY
jgi:pyruvate kinase